MNNISTNQNLPEQLDLLASQRQWYSRSKDVYLMRVAIALVFLSTSFIDFENLQDVIKPVISFCAIVFLFLDLFWLEKVQLKFKKTAAKIQEMFDSKVLQLEWNKIMLGRKPDLELVKEGVESFKKSNGDLTILNDWYSPQVSSVSLKTGRVLCQRSTIYWDGKQRRQVALSLGGIGCFILIVSVIIAVSYQVSLSDFILKSLIPMLPAFNLLLKQKIAYGVSAERLDILKDSAEELIELSKTGSDEEMMYLSRALQNEIYGHRKSSPSVPDWYYFMFRKSYEDEMVFSIEQRIKEL